MNALEAARDKRPVFTHGSLMRHVAVMTATGAIGLMAVFVVDLLSLFWVSKLGDQAFKAAVGYVGLTTFFAMSINIGLTIAASATVSRALGAGDRPRARRLAASALVITAIFSAAMAAAMFVFRDWALTTLLHARGEPAEVASKFIAISIPANVPLARRHGVLGRPARGRRRASRDVRDAVGRDRHRVSRSAADLRLRSRRLWRGLGDGSLPPDPARGRLARRDRGA